MTFGAPPASLQHGAHMLRHGRNGLRRRPVLRHRHHDFARMQVQRRCAARPVDGIAEDREARCRAMHAQLVGAAGQRRQRQPGERLAASVLAAPEHAPFGLRRQAGRIVLHPPATRRVEPAQRQVDQAFVCLRPAFDDRPIGLVDRACLEQFHQPFQRLAVAAQHKAARRVAVEPVGERGAARQAEFQMLETLFQIFAAFGAPMNGKAGGFVEDQHHAVAMDEAGNDLFRVHGLEAI